MNTEITEVVFEIEKAQEKVSPLLKTTVAEIVELVDKYGDARLKLEATEPIEKAFQDVEKLLHDILNAVLEAKETTKLRGNKYELEVGPKGDRTHITDKEKLIKFMTLDLFLKVAEPSMEDIRRYLTDDEIEQCCKTEGVIKRRIKYAKVKKAKVA